MNFWSTLGWISLAAIVAGAIATAAENVPVALASCAVLGGVCIAGMLKVIK